MKFCIHRNNPAKNIVSIDNKCYADHDIGPYSSQLQITSTDWLLKT